MDRNRPEWTGMIEIDQNGPKWIEIQTEIFLPAIHFGQRIGTKNSGHFSRNEMELTMITLHVVPSNVLHIQTHKMEPWRFKSTPASAWQCKFHGIVKTTERSNLDRGVQKKGICVVFQWREFWSFLTPFEIETQRGRELGLLRANYLSDITFRGMERQCEWHCPF